MNLFCVEVAIINISTRDLAYFFFLSFLGSWRFGLAVVRASSVAYRSILLTYPGAPRNHLHPATIIAVVVCQIAWFGAAGGTWAAVVTVVCRCSSEEEQKDRCEGSEGARSSHGLRTEITEKSKNLVVDNEQYCTKGGFIWGIYRWEGEGICIKLAFRAGMC